MTSTTTPTNRARTLLRMLLGLCVAGHLALFAYILIRRMPYPFDLEWMEGGMLLHAERISAGQAIYAPPSVDFIPFPYPPLYPTLLALLHPLWHIGYASARLVSICALVGGLVICIRWLRKSGGDTMLGVGLMAAFLAAYPLTGTWFDIARNDMLMLLCGIASLALLFRARESAKMWQAVVAGLLVGAAILTKQTAIALFCVGILWSLAFAARYLAAYAAGAVGLVIPVYFALQRQTDGWFGRWCVEAFSKHPFFPKRAFVETPIALVKHAPLLTLLLIGVLLYTGLTMARRKEQLSRSDFASATGWILIGGVGLGMASLGFGKAWAYLNAWIPGVLFPLLALGGLCAWHRVQGTKLPVWLPEAALLAHLGLHFYDPRPYLPTEADRTAGARLVGELAAMPGEVFIPYHPYYAVMAGKRPFMHRMGILDAAGAGLGSPRGLAEAIAVRKFGRIVLDDHPILSEFPGLRAHYAVERELMLGKNSPPVRSGAMTHPRFVFAPIDSHSSGAPEGTREP